MWRLREADDMLSRAGWEGCGGEEGSRQRESRCEAQSGERCAALERGFSKLLAPGNLLEMQIQDQNLCEWSPEGCILRSTQVILMHIPV